MNTSPSPADRAFVRRFESGEVAPEAFDHRAHLRLAYGYLCGSSAERAYPKMRASILSLLDRNGIGRTKYHETVTVAWLQAVHYFMRKAGEVASFDELLEADDRLLDTSIMLTHYSKARLFSDEARVRFLPPDLDPIPLEKPLDS
ncbi:MAG: hypothetical protein AAFU65_11295 [Pseudomonadota bacterium]